MTAIVTPEMTEAGIRALLTFADAPADMDLYAWIYTRMDLVRIEQEQDVRDRRLAMRVMG